MAHFTDNFEGPLGPEWTVLAPRASPVAEHVVQALEARVVALLVERYGENYADHVDFADYQQAERDLS